MTESDFNALISLLDDNDPEVSQHVWAQLLKLGAEDPDKLEAAWEVQEDPGIQRKLEEVLHKLTLGSVYDDILNWRKGGGKDMIEGWALLSRFKYPELDPQFAHDEINRLVNKTWLAINDQMSAPQKLRVLNHMLFTQEGFRNNKQHTHNPDYNYIENVFRRKMGNAVTLGLIYQTICQQLNLPVHGVIVPGYYILVFLDHEQEFYIDIFNGGLFFKREDLKRFLKDMGVEEKPSFFKPTSNIYSLLHLISYMKKDYQENGELEKVEELNDLLKHIEITFDK